MWIHVNLEERVRIMIVHERPRPGLPADALSLPARYYTDEDHYQAELERFFLGRWIHAGRVDHIPGAGDYVLRDVAGESVIITRADDNTIHAFYNVCRHRGTRLCEPTEGTFPGMIRCPYHAWAYDLHGRLVAAPQMDGLPHFRKEDYPLHEIAVSLWDGHIFLNLSHNPPLLEQQLADLREKFRPWGMDQFAWGGESSTTWRPTGS